MSLDQRSAALAVLLASGCAAYGLHGPARVLDGREQQIALTFDVVRFVARNQNGERPPGALDAWLLLPGVKYRRGVGGGAELELEAFPVGLRAGVRARIAGDAASRGALSAGAGCSLVAAWLEAPRDGGYGPLLLPDLSLAAGYRPSPASELYAALRYLWLRQQIAGSSFAHTPGLTLGYRHAGDRLTADVESTLLAATRRAGDLAVVPGFGVGLRSR